MFKPSFLIFLLTISGALHADWKDIPASNISTSEGRLYIQVEDKSIVRDGGFVTIWFRMRWGTTGTVQQYNSSFDCKKRSSNTNDGFQYSTDTPDKKYPMSKKDFTPVVPGTASEVVLEHVCTKKLSDFWK